LEGVPVGPFVAGVGLPASKVVVQATPTPDHVVMQYGYDLAGNQRFTIDEHGNETDYVYDALYRVVETHLPVANAVVHTGYDLTGHPLLQTDANGKATTAEDDNVYRLKQKTDPLGNAVVYTYDAAGHVVRETHQSGAITTYVITYDNGEKISDGLGRPTTKTETVYLGDPTGSSTQTATYVTQVLYDDAHNRVVT